MATPTATGQPAESRGVRDRWRSVLVVRESACRQCRAGLQIVLLVHGVDREPPPLGHIITGVGEDDTGGQPAGPRDEAVLVAWSVRRRSPSRQFAALVLQGSQVRLMDADGEVLLEAEGDSLSADIASPTQVELHEPDGTVRYLVGPLPQWGKRGTGAKLVTRYGAQLIPDPDLVHPEGRMSRFMVTAATSQLRRLRLWPPVLVSMLRSHGVKPVDERRDAESAGEDGLGQ